MRAPLAAIALLALGACTVPQGSGAREFEPYAPLRAHIVPPTGGGPMFHVNRPAYVAMFYIVPGGGVSMLYPGFASGSLDGRVFGGTHFARGRLTNSEQYRFATRGLTASPRFYFLIASDRPLNVRQFGAFGDGLTSRLGTAFGSFSAYSTMERLARVALPSVTDDGSWTTDMYVEWPNVIGNEPGGGRVMMQCGGYVMYVPMEYVPAVQALVCDARDEAEEQAEEEERGPVVKPRSRDPIPAEAQGGKTEEIRSMDPKALVERISASTQLTEAVARRPMVSGGRDELGRSGARAGVSSGGVSRGAASPSSGSSGSSGTVSSGRSGPVSAPASRPSSSGDSGSGSGAGSGAGSGGGGGGGGGGSGPVTAPTNRGGG